MTKLKIQFSLFFSLLAALIILLLSYSYKQIAKEEYRLWQGISENAYNQMQARISEFLTQEDNRSFSEYNYYYIPETQIPENTALSVSPLSQIPKDDSRGIIGYFQIDSEGTFHTPYLPTLFSSEQFLDRHSREILRDHLNELTTSFQTEVINSFSKKDLYEEKKIPPIQNIIDLSAIGIQSDDNLTEIDEGFTGFAAKENTDEDTTKSTNKKTKSFRQNSKWGKRKIYPNPLRQQKSDVPSDDVSLENKLENSPSPDKIFEEMFSPKDQPEENTDPFRARLVNNENLIFYRKVWVDNKIYLQGFAVKLQIFYNWLMETSFENSRLPEFACANLNIQNKLIVQYAEESNRIRPLFKRALGYPLNQFSWQVAYSSLPHLSTYNLLNILTALLFIIATGGLFILYHSTAKEITLSQKRQDFVAAVTHELKTPLTSIRMYSEMLTAGWIKEIEKKKEYYQIISSESDRLSRLIDNVLQLARLEKKNYKYNLITDSPKDRAREIAKELQVIAEQKGFEWKDQIPNNLPAITYDSDVIKQILITLVDNSIKFSQETTKKIIEMTIKEHEKKIIWSIRDYGPGVPRSELKKIFKKFYRIENEMTRKTKGTGIGLAMANILMQGMNAEIKAENKDEGGLQVSLIFRY